MGLATVNNLTREIMTTEYTFEQLEQLLDQALEAVGGFYEHSAIPGNEITLDQIEALQIYTSNMNELIEKMLDRLKHPEDWD